MKKPCLIGVLTLVISRLHREKERRLEMTFKKSGSQGGSPQDSFFKRHWYLIDIEKSDDEFLADNMIPSNAASGIKKMLVSESGMVETVLLQFSVTPSASHKEISQIAHHMYSLQLTAPSGNKSTVTRFSSNPDTGEIVMSSNAFYGESIHGVWQIQFSEKKNTESIKVAPHDYETLSQWNYLDYRFWPGG